MKVTPRGHIPTRCSICATPLLNPHELTGVCLECKLVLRNERMSDLKSENPESTDTTGETA
jgi:hypothetical protein